jgi:DNA-binding protein HU-beta
MNKKELVATITESAQLEKIEVEKVIAGFISAVTSALAQGKTIKLIGFGSFVPKDYAASMKRNPRTGERVEVPARRKVTFRAGQGLKGSLQ